MAHKTLINGTAYDVVGGTTLVNNTGYKISKGVTLIGGTQYDIGFDSGVSFDWGTDGGTVDASWAQNLQSYLQSATPAEIERDIPIGGWKSTFNSSNQQYYISVIGVNQDGDNTVTFWCNTPSARIATRAAELDYFEHANTDYDNSYYQPYIESQAKLMAIYPYFKTVHKKSYSPTSSSYASTYNTTPSEADVKVWAPSFDEIAGLVTPQDIGMNRSYINPYKNQQLIESEARYTWPPTKYAAQSYYMMPTRTHALTTTGANGQSYFGMNTSGTINMDMTMTGGNGHSVGWCFAIG